MFTLWNYHYALEKCKHGVSFKRSVQSVLSKKTESIQELYWYLHTHRNVPKLTLVTLMIIYERGKPREITPIKFKDRLTQCVLCDKCLIPLIEKSLIYDNGASQLYKGVHFARERVVEYLHEAIRIFGKDFYILQFDFQSYFKSVPHKTCERVLRKYIHDEEIIKTAMETVIQYQRGLILQDESKPPAEKRRLVKSLEEYNGIGISLGSQVSQILAVLVPNAIDHHIKDNRRMKYYERYMDDGIIFARTKSELKNLYKEITEIAKDLGLHFNKKKTKIVKSSKGFTYMKIKYRVDKNGRLSRALSRESIVRMRRKMKGLKRKYDKGEITLDDVYASVQSWFATARYAAKGKTVREMERLYNELFGGYKITKRYFRHEARAKARLQRKLNCE